MIQRLIALRSQGVSHWCWGYSFPWQTRTIVVPSGVPNLVCTTFVGDALLDAYEQLQDPGYLDMATSTAEYILDELYWTDGKSVAGFSYPLPKLKNQVPNANFLGAALLCRVYQHTNDRKFLDPALRVARLLPPPKQHADGSWGYGEGPSQRWIDNFHTGYNLCALRSIGRYAGTTEFESRIRRGFEFYPSPLFPRGRRTQVFSQPYVSSGHSLCCAKYHHASCIQRSRPAQCRTGALGVPMGYESYVG